MRPTARCGVSLAAVALVCLLLALGGCGGDDEGAADTDTQTTPATPTVTKAEPATPTTTAPSPDTEQYRTAPAPALPNEPGSGGTRAPSPASPEDSPANDIPPPPGSPAERFERQCEMNPASC